MLAAVALATLVCSSFAKARTLEQRVTAGECADETLAGTELFPITYLSSYRSLSSSALDSIDDSISSAKLIEIHYGSSFKVLNEKHAKEQYVLVQCGAESPSDADISAVAALPAGFKRKVFAIPLQKVMMESTVQLGFLHALNLHDRVAHVTEYAVGACWQTIIGCNASGVVRGTHGSSSDEAKVDLQKTRENMDAVFMDCPWSQVDGAWEEDCAGLHSISNAIHFSASQDPAPIHSAEHIKFMAAFFNKEDDAQKLFDSEVSTMKALKTQVSAIADADKPTVAWVEVDWESKAKLITHPFKKVLVELAGAKSVDAAAVKAALGDKMNDAYVTADTRAFLQALADNGVTVLIDETYSSDVAQYDFNKFLTSFNVTATSDLPFIKNKMVMRTDSGYSGTSNVDWLESRLVHPTTAVQGLQRVLNSDNSKKTFFRNIAKDEKPDKITKDSCTKTLAMCSTTDLPNAIPLINRLGQATDADSAVSLPAMVGFVMSVLAASLQ